MTSEDVGGIKNDSQSRLRSVPEIMWQSGVDLYMHMEAKLGERTIVQLKNY